MLDNYFLEDKENLPTIDSLNYSAMKFSINLLQQSALAKKAKAAKVKVQKNLNNSVRAGDWICLVCNNLNFSFRNECNRCQMQTKKQNYIQNLLLISDKKQSMDFKPERQALRDLTNIPTGEDQSLNRSFNEETDYTTISGNAPPGLGVQSRQIQNSQNKFNDYDFSPNYGFENAILLTPPRFNNHEQYTSPAHGLSESNNKMILPYQSPKQLPSVSPILRKVLSYNECSNEDHNSKYMNLKYRGSHARSNSQSSLERTEGKTKPSDSDNGAVDNFNFEEMNKCIQETILNEHNHNYSHHSHSHSHNHTFIDYSAFNHTLIKENINPAIMGIEKNFTSLFSGFNMSEDASKSQGKKERKADWVCQWCNNLNYSFRKFCNRCQILR